MRNEQLNSMKRLLIYIFIFYSTSSLAQKTCTSSPTTISANINFGSITWTATGGATVAECNNMADGLITFTGNVIVDLANNKTITISNNVSITGNFPISGGPGSTLTVSGNSTLHVTGNLGDAASNGVQYNVAAAGDRIIVDGTLFGKNNNAFIGAGSISGGTLDVKNGSTCGSPCPVSGGFTNCLSGDPFCTNNNVLPVTLISFSGNSLLNSINLKWATASELNFDFFSVERSEDGLIFSEVAQVKGHGTTNERHDYTLDDRFPITGKSYDRLTTVDFDKYTETFNIIAVNYTAEKSARIFPNPATGGKLNIELTYTPTRELILIVIDLNGVEMLRNKIKDRQTSLQVDFNPGTYLVKIIDSDFSKVIRVLVDN